MPLSDDTVLVRASGDGDPPAKRSGSARIFTRSGSARSKQARTTAGDGVAGDNLGSAVPLSGSHFAHPFFLVQAVLPAYKGR